jgi:hypothetical protein
MRKFIGSASPKSDEELLSLSHEGPIFQGIDAALGALRSGLKGKAKLKEREATAELLEMRRVSTLEFELERAQVCLNCPVLLYCYRV